MAREEPDTLIIFPDFGGAWDWGDYPYDDIPEDLRTDFENWTGLFECCSEFLFFDWKAYHIHGLRLAFQAKKVLGKEVKVIYQPPFEDPNFYCQKNDLASGVVEILLDEKGRAYIENYQSWEDSLITPFETQAKLFKEIFNNCYDDSLYDTKEEALQAEAEIFANSAQIVDRFIAEFEKAGWHRFNFHQSADFWGDSLFEELLYCAWGLKDDEMLRLVQAISDNRNYTGLYYQNHALVYQKAIRAARYSYQKTCAYLINQLPENMVNLPLYPDDPVDTAYDCIECNYYYTNYLYECLPPCIADEKPTEEECNDNDLYLCYLERMAIKNSLPMPYALRALRSRGGLTHIELVEKYGTWLPNSTLGFHRTNRYRQTDEQKPRQFCLAIDELVGLNAGAYVDMQALLDSLHNDGEYVIFLNKDLSPLPIVQVSHIRKGQFIQWQLQAEKICLNGREPKREKENITVCFARCQVLTAFNHFMLELRDHIQLTGQKDCGNLYDADCHILRDIWLKFSLPFISANVKNANHIDLAYRFDIASSLINTTQEEWIKTYSNFKRNPFYAPVKKPERLSAALLTTFEDWLQGYAVSGGQPLFDWQAFHKTGFELALKAKEQLGQGVEVKYIPSSFHHKRWAYSQDNDCLESITGSEAMATHEIMLDINGRAYSSEKINEPDDSYAKPLWQQAGLVEQFTWLANDMYLNNLFDDNLVVRRIEILNLIIDLLNRGVQLNRYYLTGEETLGDTLKGALAKVLPDIDYQWIDNHLAMMCRTSEQIKQKAEFDTLSFAFNKSSNTSLESSLLVNREKQPQLNGFTINIEALIDSLKQSGAFFIFTCDCGVPDCTGIYEGVKVIHNGNNITWQLQEPLGRIGVRTTGCHSLSDGAYQWQLSKKQLKDAVANALLTLRDYGYLKNRYNKAEPNMTCDIATHLSAGAGLTAADIWQQMSLKLAKVDVVSAWENH